jgi:hypothetical protein
VSFYSQVKTRLQAADCARNANQMTIARDIMRSDGVLALWRGTNPAAARAALLTASQCVTYDVVKSNIRYYTGSADNLPVQVATGMPAPLSRDLPFLLFLLRVGFATNCVIFCFMRRCVAFLNTCNACMHHASSADQSIHSPEHACTGAITGVVTTTVTNPADVLKTRMFAGASGGVVQACSKLIAEEGASALFKGWMANYVRLGPQTMIIFLVSEQLRKAFGLSAL